MSLILNLICQNNSSRNSNKEHVPDMLKNEGFRFKE